MSGSPSGRFAGRTCLITGATGGIGRAVLERWLADGGSAWATDVTEPPLSHPGVVSRALDVTDPMSWSMIMAEVEGSSGSIDTLLLCHGVSQPHVPTADLDLVDWNRVLDINLTGCFLGIQATLPAMVERGFGRVVAVASIAAKEASAGEHVYAASKAGLVALIKSVGKEVATTGVTLNSVAPGPVETPLWDALSDSLKSDRLRRTPMERPARPDEVASIMLWLASEEASYTTAQVFDASGGRATY
jgi:3-oxoacyl-[acyl-carrier protein] reductase